MFKKIKRGIKKVAKNVGDFFWDNPWAAGPLAPFAYTSKYLIAPAIEHIQAPGKAREEEARQAAEVARQNAVWAREDADELRRDAERTMAEVIDQSDQVREFGERSLSTGMTVLGKTGALGFSDSLTRDSGVDVGTLESDELTRLREAGATDDVAVLERANATQAIGGPSNLLRASGSDLLSMVHTRDMIERDRRKLIRMGQQEAGQMIFGADRALSMGELYDRTGAHFDRQEHFARQSRRLDTFTTVLNFGTSAAKTAFTFGLF